MTLQKFSDKSFLSMLINKLKSAVFFPIVGFFLIGIFAVAQPFSTVVALNSDGAYYYGIADGVTLDNMNYILFGDAIPLGDEYSSVLMYFIAIVASILTAIVVFKDLSNKKTANVYYSLGFSRTKLFASTYLAGALSVLGMVLIPFLLSFIINCFSFGISKELVTATIFVLSCLANVSLIAYTISSIAMTLSGMVVEGAFFAFFLNATTPIFTFAACMFSDGLLTGGGFVSANDYYYSSFENSFEGAFLGRISFLNALSHSVEEVGRLNCCLLTADTELFGGFLSSENWTTPKFVPLLVWSVILIGLVFLATYAFNKKKTENIGFFASNPILYRIFIGTLIVGFTSLGCSSGRTITKGLTWLYILIFLAVCLVLAAIVVFILTRLSRMKFKKEFKVFGIYAAAVIAFAAVFSTGFFGYQNRIPVAEKVESVTINGFSSSIYDDYAQNGELYGEYYGEADPILMGTFGSGDVHIFTSKADIESIRELHKGLIAADSAKISQKYKETKIGCKINVVYTLKNGKTISRSYYRITPQLIDTFVNGKGVSECIKQNLIQKLNYMLFSSNNEDIYGYDESLESERIYTVFSKDFISAKNVELKEEQLSSLFTAYTTDIENLSVNEILKPTKKAVGAIAFRSEYIVRGEYDEETEEEEILGNASEIEYGTYNPANTDQYEGEGFIVINENMVNTIKWAKEVGIYKYFKVDKEVKIATVEVAHNNSSLIKLSISDNHNFNLLFTAKSYRDYDTYSSMYFNNQFVNLVGSHFAVGLTEDEINFLRENAHPYYLTTETGYFVRFTPDESLPVHATVFVPDSKLTPELRTKLAVGGDSVSEPYTAYEGVTTVAQIVD